MLLSAAQHDMGVRILQERDREWVGKAVVARRDEDGVYYPGWPILSTMCGELIPESLSATVIEILDKQCFKLQWVDGSHQKQSVLHMFGSLTNRRKPQAGDHVLALAMPGEVSMCSEL